VSAYSEAEPAEEDVLTRIQAAVSLADVVRRYTEEVEEKGDGEYMCRCLFHKDHRPSMSVNADKGVYHCFSCGASGNLFKFVSEMEGLSFPEAVAFLADEAGIELPRGGSFSPGKDYSRLHQALEAASEYYASMLAEASGGPARSHLRKRKTSPVLAADFQLGFSPLQPGGLWEHLAPLNFTQDELVASGLFSPRALQVLRLPPASEHSNHVANATANAAATATATSAAPSEDGGDAKTAEAAAAPAPAPARRLPFDRMGGRLVIPIRNARGQMVGFSGRLLADEPLAKYINTRETAIFKKRSLLYGLHRARASIRETGRAIVVEGYFDVISLHGVGVRACVRVDGVCRMHATASAIGFLASFSSWG
jgi:DNA primase